MYGPGFDEEQLTATQLFCSLADNLTIEASHISPE